ncbi:hypothetical protein [Halobacteriovorax sp. YZS-1-1]|uniref:hypothetical protein n=1 Tax=unclassified Halobacteriovorax TaxID=2639665 RepID=UPI003999D564
MARRSEVFKQLEALDWNFSEKETFDILEFSKVLFELIKNNEQLHFKKTKNILQDPRINRISKLYEIYEDFFYLNLKNLTSHKEFEFINFDNQRDQYLFRAFSAIVTYHFFRSAHDSINKNEYFIFTSDWNSCNYTLPHSKSVHRNPDKKIRRSTSLKDISTHEDKVSKLIERNLKYRKELELPEYNEADVYSFIQFAIIKSIYLNQEASKEFPKTNERKTNAIFITNILSSFYSLPLPKSIHNGVEFNSKLIMKELCLLDRNDCLVPNINEWTLAYRDSIKRYNFQSESLFGQTYCGKNFNNNSFINNLEHHRFSIILETCLILASLEETSVYLIEDFYLSGEVNKSNRKNMEKVLKMHSHLKEKKESA